MLPNYHLNGSFRPNLAIYGHIVVEHICDWLSFWLVVKLPADMQKQKRKKGKARATI